MKLMFIAAAMLVAFILAATFAGGESPDRNVPGGTTGPGKSNLVR